MTDWRINYALPIYMSSFLQISSKHFGTYSSFVGKKNAPFPMALQLLYSRISILASILHFPASISLSRLLIGAEFPSWTEFRLSLSWWLRVAKPPPWMEFQDPWGFTFPGRLRLYSRIPRSWMSAFNCYFAQERLECVIPGSMSFKSWSNSQQLKEDVWSF
jgi:hypothetical protein